MKTPQQLTMTPLKSFPILTALNKNSYYSSKLANADDLLCGVIVEVSNLDQAKTAESAGACCVCIITPPPPSRLPDPSLIRAIKRSLKIPVMVRARAGHYSEAQILQALGVDYIDESSDVSDEGAHFIDNKHNFKTPFVCGCRDLGEALSRISEGAVLLRIQGSPQLCETVRNVRKVMGKEVRAFLSNMGEDELSAYAEKMKVPRDVVVQTKLMGRATVHGFASGGIVTPLDAALLMHFGCSGVFVGAEVFDDDGGDVCGWLRLFVLATKRYDKYGELSEAMSRFERDSVRRTV